MNESMGHQQERVAILGAGVSGLSCASLLKERGYDVTIFEASDRIGGLARSFEWHGFFCDIAPHRLFTHDKEALEHLLALVPMKKHQRRSKICIGGKMVRDPVNPVELLLRFSPRLTSRLVFGYLFKPKLPEESFENMAINKFGHGLYEFFFKPYTEKMFGVSPAEISVEWGRQKLRVSGLKDVFRRNTKIFFREFYYPKERGYGAISEALYEKVRGSVRFNSRVTGLELGDGEITGVTYTDANGSHAFPCDRVVSTIPATILGRMLGRDFSFRFQAVQLVYFLVAKPRIMPYHWVYFGDRDVVINRFAEFKNFSDSGTPDDKTVAVAEITVPTDDPVKDALAGLERYGLLREEDVLDTKLIYERFGYPVYDQHFDVVRVEAEEEFGRYHNLHLVGRNAEFRHIEVDEDYAAALALVRSLEQKPPSAAP
ncbi:MAG: FAD-dependent oxidoreductase [Acidobacteria bacterium]|nr:FAD-dependent oxidoreductase [Acidobacteriota bacterium]